MTFEAFRAYIREFSILFHEICFCSKILSGFWKILVEFKVSDRPVESNGLPKYLILSSSCGRLQKIDYKCFCYPENEAQSLDFSHSLTISSVIQAVCFGTSL